MGINESGSSMHWTDPIDGYCERLSAAFWAEPANAVSNLAFILAAGLALVAWRSGDVEARRSRGRRDVAGLFLIAVVFVIGIGSFLFHTFANRWSSLADVVPIAVFIYVYFGLALYRLVGLGLVVSILATLAFLAASVFGENLFAPLVGSSSGYVPALLALLGIGLWLVVRGGPQGALVLAAGLVFTLSLVMRMADMPYCDRFPLGTHFLWHILNATTLGLLLFAAIRQGVRARQRRITA